LDFGLAHSDARWSDTDAGAATVEMTLPGTISGTIGYMSPEQAQGLGGDARSDVFSFGCIVYEALTHRRAFEGRSVIETLRQTIASDPAPLRDVSPDAPAELQPLMSRCLAKDPNARYANMREVAVELRR